MQISAAHLEQHRPALVGHCYRMMGSAVDADDAVQETLVRAWRALERFDGRASMRTWLYRIATNVCLSMLSQRERRARPIESGHPGGIDGPFDQLPREHWIEPISDAAAVPSDADPAEAVALRQSIRLAFVAALQHLPAKQRAVLLLAEVLGWSAAEIAESLETSVASVNSALQRARASLAGKQLEELRAPLTPEQTTLVQKYQDAFLSYDIDTLVSLLHDDATFSMPPHVLWLQGPKVVREWMLGPGCGCKGSRLIPVRACGALAFAQYRPGGPDGAFTPWALIHLELGDHGIAGITSFLDTQTLFPRFGVPDRLTV